MSYARVRLAVRASLTFTAAAAMTVLAACGGGAEAAAAAGAGGAGGGGGRPGGGGPGGGGGQPSPVEIAVVARTSMARTSTVTGQLAPVRAVGVNSQIAGALLTVNVEEGSRVTKGELMAEIDPRELTAQVRAAEAALAFAKSTAERSTTLYEAKVITVVEFERDRTALASAEASLAQLKTRLDFTKVLSPLDGVVTQRFVRDGDIVGAQAALFTVADVSTLVTLLPVSELEVPMLRTGATVPVQVDALQATVNGRIRRIFPAADSLNRLVPVEVAIPGNAIAGLRPGYTVRATLRLDERQNVLMIPSRAVVGAQGSQSVYVIKNGRAERRRVRVGTDTDGQTEVVEGVVFGDSVITTGNALLRDGAQVRIVQPLAPEAPAAAKTVPAGKAP
ncbi:MAG: efflux RND transporter periplasmic adaptor subunit [Gemmatimonadaceae bacterium]|nr:efflux RND transporter periplasmic adaptor subunit [Gemmatimonadaceae bacterium]